jgi:hypothetical protein
MHLSVVFGGNVIHYLEIQSERKKEKNGPKNIFSKMGVQKMDTRSLPEATNTSSS